ncbi:hypothetical protein ACFSQQ_21880 [Mesorhizobium kowhaii]|uniref:hypothetical protein n=1 Tax=Mesorhizobium kowhaii TaxID=1300272 RepID=UPI0035E926B4
MVAPRKTLDRLFDDAEGTVQSRLTSGGVINPTRRSLLAAGCFCLASCFATPLFADAPMVKSQAPGFYRLAVGDFEITALSDGSNMLPATKLLQGDPARIEEALKRNYLGDLIETSHNSFLVNTGAKLVLIDAGAGSLLGATTGHLLSNLRASGSRSMNFTSHICTRITLGVSWPRARELFPMQLCVSKSGTPITG